jgi:hypothetical protein
MKVSSESPGFARFVVAPIAVAASISVLAFSPVTVRAKEPAVRDQGAVAAMPMDHSMMAGMSGMEGRSATGDTDYDFASNMRKHHQMAVHIMTAQKKEVAMFDRWLATHKPPESKGTSKP